MKDFAHQASLFEHSFDHVGALLSAVEVLQAVLGQLLDQVVLHRLPFVHEVAFVALGLDELDSNELQLFIQFQNSILQLLCLSFQRVLEACLQSFPQSFHFFFQRAESPNHIYL